MKFEITAGRIGNRCEWSALSKSLAITAVISALFNPALVAAQSQSQQGSQAGVLADVDTLCMESTLRDVGNVPVQSRGQRYTVIVAASDVPSLTAKGFLPTDCRSAGLASPQQLRAQRDDACELTHYGDIAIYDQFETATGVRPDVLCRGAELAAGPWEPPPER